MVKVTDLTRSRSRSKAKDKARSSDRMTERNLLLAGIIFSIIAVVFIHQTAESHINEHLRTTFQHRLTY